MTMEEIKYYNFMTSWELHGDELKTILENGLILQFTLRKMMETITKSFITVILYTFANRLFFVFWFEGNY